MHIVALLITQKLQLPFIFYTLGSDRELETFCHLNNRGSDPFFIPVLMQIVNETAIDLELADRKLLEVAEA